MQYRIKVLITAGRGPKPARAFVAMLAEFIDAQSCAMGLKALSPERSGCADPSHIWLEYAADDEGFQWIRSRAGTHALSDRQRPGPKARRTRWFARVLVYDNTETSNEASDLELSEADLDWRAIRASGPGGQHVNKASTAVRLLHRPTGERVLARNQRSQQRNRAAALDELRQRLRRAAHERTGRDKRAKHGDVRSIDRGAAAFVYQLDHRGRLCPRAERPPTT